MGISPCGLASVSGFRWADIFLGLGSWTRGVRLERVHGTAGFILAFLDTEFGLLRVRFCFPPRLKNLPPILVLLDWVLRGRGGGIHVGLRSLRDSRRGAWRQAPHRR